MGNKFNKNDLPRLFCVQIVFLWSFEVVLKWFHRILVSMLSFLYNYNYREENSIN